LQVRQSGEAVWLFLSSAFWNAITAFDMGKASRP
jgi:hypothetical protein